MLTLANDDAARGDRGRRVGVVLLFSLEVGVA